MQEAVYSGDRRQENIMDPKEDDSEHATQIVLHEDKKYYPSAEEVYGKGTETLVMEEDAQPLEVATLSTGSDTILQNHHLIKHFRSNKQFHGVLQVPIIAPVKQKKFQVVEQKELKSNYKAEFLTALMGTPLLTRNIAIAGHLHHGKTVVTSSTTTALNSILLPLSTRCSWEQDRQPDHQISTR